MSPLIFIFALDLQMVIRKPISPFTRMAMEPISRFPLVESIEFLWKMLVPQVSQSWEAMHSIHPKTLIPINNFRAATITFRVAAIPVEIIFRFAHFFRVASPPKVCYNGNDTIVIHHPKEKIDGSEGTTGLRIHERLDNRDDIELLTIAPELRKDPAERSRLINSSDITFLCLPDSAAREAVALVTNPNTRIIDASTAHRTEAGWAYGFPELSAKHREAIRTGKRIANPGCHASGFISLVYPLIAGGILPADYPVASFSLTGYSGGGKKMIAQYEASDRDAELDAPREYGLSQQHKHLKEMRLITGLSRAPLFTPIVSDYYSGMVVNVPLYTDLLNTTQTPESLQAFFADYYANEPFVKVMPLGAESEMSGFLSGNHLSGYDGMQIYITGNENRIQLSSVFDNLGKGASGAAIQCFNIMTGCDETKGLNL